MLNLDRPLYEHLSAGDRSDEASSTTCNWETFGNLTKEQYKKTFCDTLTYLQTDSGFFL